MSNFVELQFNKKILIGGSTPTISHTSVATGVAAINPSAHTPVAYNTGIAHMLAVHTPVASGVAAINPAAHTPVADHTPVAHHTGIAHMAATSVASGVAAINPAVHTPVAHHTGAVPPPFATFVDAAAAHTPVAHHTGIAYN